MLVMTLIVITIDFNAASNVGYLYTIFYLYNDLADVLVSNCITTHIFLILFLKPRK